MERRPILSLATPPKHPLGWSCGTCRHVVRDPSPGSEAMKCVRYPPTAQATMDPVRGLGFMSISPPVQPGEWCGEYSPNTPLQS